MDFTPTPEAVEAAKQAYGLGGKEWEYAGEKRLQAAIAAFVEAEGLRLEEA